MDKKFTVSTDAVCPMGTTARKITWDVTITKSHMEHMERWEYQFNALSSEGLYVEDVLVLSREPSQEHLQNEMQYWISQNLMEEPDPEQYFMHHTEY